MSDAINPSHYKHLPVEAIDIIDAAIAKAPSNEAAYLHGQVLKYTLRCWEKNGFVDLGKAKWYLDRLVASFDDLLAEINAPILEGASEETDQDDHPDHFQVGETVVSWQGREGIVEAINLIEDFPVTVRHSVREQVSYKLGGVKKKGGDHPGVKPQPAPPKRSRTQPPSGYRLLGDAKVEPRIEGDQYWSLAIRGWTVLTSLKVEYANRDNWAACRKIEKRSEPPPDLSQMGVQVISEIEPPRRYREPTLADLANGPIECEYRGDDGEQWRSGLLVYILKGVMPFLCTDKEELLCGQWEQCRIEVQE